MEKFNIKSSFNQLNQDEKSDIELCRLIDGETSFLIAELKPGKTLPAHFHTEGSEIYHILSGTGKMETGKVSKNSVAWEGSHKIAAGDVFEIKSNVVHRLSNEGTDSLKIVFVTPPSHLGDDRFFI
ncbi:MAG: cupin domain-containing protein [Desulfobacteraceae bacterium]|nr:MAG: cupin domain-containing protein [Desulfobacteraceae bacterium]